MAFFNARAPIGFRWANAVLLEAARHPDRHAELIYSQAVVGPGTDPRCHPRNPFAFVELSRQCCACVVINCAAELWSVLAHGLLVLEPSNPITEDVRQFLKEERLSNLRFFEHYFKLCGKPFRGTKTYEDTKLIYDLRDAIVHDRPDDANVDVEQEIDKWIGRLSSRVREEELAWLPEIPTLCPDGFPVPSESSRVAVMNFMRYPLASWVIQATQHTCSEMSDMYFAFPGAKRLVSCAILTGVPESLATAPLAESILVGGISKQIVRSEAGPEPDAAP